MLDIRLFRDQPDFVRAGLEKAHADPSQVEEVRSLDERVRSLKTEAEAKKAELNAANKLMGKASPEERETKRAELRALGDSIKGLDEQRDELEKRLHALLLEIPNLPDERTPPGADESDKRPTQGDGSRACSSGASSFGIAL